MRLTRRRIGVGVASAAVVAVLALAALRSDPVHASPGQRPAWPPLPHRVTVEVLNAGRVAGASRVATEWLRHAGLDVVYFGNADSSLLKPLLRRHPVLPAATVIMRTGDSTGTGRAVAVLGGAALVDLPDATRLVDLTVIIGDSFSVHRRAP